MAQVALSAGLSFVPVVGPFAAALGGLLGAELDRKMGLYGKPEPVRAPDVQVTMASEGTPGTLIYGLRARVPLHYGWTSSFIYLARSGQNKRALSQPTTVSGNLFCVASFQRMGEVDQILAEGKRIAVTHPSLNVTTTTQSTLVTASAGVQIEYRVNFNVPRIYIRNTRDGGGNPIAGSPDLSVFDVGELLILRINGVQYNGSTSTTVHPSTPLQVAEARIVDAAGNSILILDPRGGNYSIGSWSGLVTGNFFNSGLSVDMFGNLAVADPRVFLNGGAPTQLYETKSPLLTAYNGADATSRYPGVAAVDLPEVSLAPWGNRAPQLECIAEGYDDSGTGGRDRTLVADTIEDLLVAHAGLETTDVDLSGVDPALELGGLAISTPFQPADALQSLFVANDLVLQEGTGGDFRGFARIIEGSARDSVALDTEALNCAIGDGPFADEDIEHQRVDPNERVRVATIAFSNYENALMGGEEAERMDSIRLGQELTLDLRALTMTPTAAKRIARRLMRESAVRIAKARIVVGWEAWNVQTDDVVTLTDRDGEDWTLLVDRIATTPDYLHEIEGYVIADVPAAAPAGSGAPESGSRAGDAGGDPKAVGACPLVFVAAECRPLADDHASKVGFYVGAAPAGAGVAFEGATVWIRRTGDEWLEVGTLPKAALIGYVATATASGTLSGYDATTEIDVEIRHGTPAGTTEALCDLGRNLALVGSEVVGFTGVTTVDAENFTLDNLSRGRCDTAAEVGGHADGESFLLLNEAVAFVPLAIEDIGTDVEVAVTSPGASVDDAIVETLTIVGLTATPIELDSVALASSSGKLTATWTYRSLRSSRFRAPTTEPVEPGETVRLEFWNSTVAGISGSAVYTIDVPAGAGSYRVDDPGAVGIVGTDVAVRAKVRSSLVGLVSTPSEDDLSVVFVLPLDPSDLDFDEGDASTIY